jgi:beta-phosphoglucomutase-like phosphatase (HAD superfamily)
VSADDTHASKPAPEPYLRALQALSAKTGSTLPPRQCVAVEDSLWGLESARAAGLQTVAVTHTYSAAVLSPASLTISSLHDLQLGSLAQLCPD